MLSDPSPQAATFRLSPQQAFLLGRTAPAASQCLVALENGTSPDNLRSRLRGLIARHEALRTTFVTPPGARAPVAQTIHDGLDPGWECCTPQADPMTDTRARDALLDVEAARLDLESGPTIRALLIERRSQPGVLLLTAAAAVADERSLLLLASELLASAAHGPEAEPIQQADYAEWRHELAGRDETDAARGRAFWSEAVEEIGRETLLFGARGAPSGEWAAKTVRIDLEREQLDLLAARASELSVGVEALLRAAWHALLCRVAGCAEVLTAELADGRSQPDLADAVGSYAQVVPIRVPIAPETRFVELIDRLGRAGAEARRWLEYGSEGDLVRLTDRATGGFNATAAAGGGALAFLSPGRTGCAIELRWPGDGGFELGYDPRTYDARDAEDLALELGTLLAAALADPSQRIDALALMPAAGREQVLALGTGMPPAEVDPECVHHAFERQAARTPDRAALTGDGRTITFGELNRQVNRLAHHLLALGAGPDQPIGLCMHRTPAMVTALLAIMKAGGAYLPLNLAHPSARLAHQLSEAGARILISEESLLDRLAAGTTATVVCVDRDAEAISAGPTDDPLRRSDPDGLAYIMYTSGSTGTPKGVAVTHRNLATYVAAISRRLGAEEGMQFAVLSEISTDLGNTALFPPLVSGGCLHVIGNEPSMDGAAFAAYVSENPIDVIKITPTHLRALLAAGDGFLPRRWLVLGGEPLSWELVERVQAIGAGCSLLNHYGPTETTVGCCTFEVAPGQHPLGSATVPIGRPLAGVRAYILDANLEPLPVGVVGELCIGGFGVARGYVDRPEETSQRFVAGPQGGRMYRTGDRARFQRDGSIEFLGRLDHQLKIRGYRVEPGEIEAALLRHPAIREAAVIARDIGDGDPRLVAYYLAAEEQAPLELQAFVAQSLPDYMVPSRWVSIKAFPLTPSGKIDRRALPDPNTVRAGRRGEFVAPRDELEREIAAIWAALLGLEEVGAMDDFFALGGHSLLATQVIMRVRRRYGDVPLGALFNSPTVAALADAIRARAGG